MAGRKILKVRNALSSFQLHGFVALHHDAKFRLDEFDAALAYAGLGRDDLADWLVRLPERPPRNEELRPPASAPNTTPRAHRRKQQYPFSGTTGQTGTEVDRKSDLLGRREVERKRT